MTRALSAKAAIIMAVVIGSAGAAAYQNAPSNGYTNFDDKWQVIENPLLGDVSRASVMSAVSAPYHGMYLPVKTLSYMADYLFYPHLGMDAVFGVHLTSVILHIVNSILVGVICLVVLRDFAGDNTDGLGALFVAVFSGVLFVLHPVHVESVAWLSGRKDVLSFFFMALSFLAFRGCLLSLRVRAGRLACVACVVFFVLALGSKATVACFPLIATAYWGLVRRRGGKRAALVLVALYALAAGAIAVGMTVMSRGGYQAAPLEGSYVTQFLTGIKTFPFYMRLLLFPINQSAIYSLPAARGLFDSGVLAGLALGAAQLCVVIFVKARTAKFIVLWYILGLLPVLGLVPVAVPALAADRYAYIASVPFALAPALILWNVRAVLLKRGSVGVATALVAAAVIYAGVLGGATYSRNRVWRSSKSLWRDVLAKNPTSRMALVNLGQTYFEGSDYERAKELLEKATKADPNYTLAHYKLGLTYERMGRINLAKLSHKKALSPRSSHTAKYGNEYRGRAACRLASIYFDEGQYEAAREHAETALWNYPLRRAESLRKMADDAAEASRKLADDLCGLAGSLTTADPARAESIYLRAGEVALEYPAPQVGLGMLYLDYGRWEKADEAFSVAFLLGADGGEFQYCYGTAALGRRRYRRAEKRFRRALQYDPTMLKAKVKLANALGRQGHYEEALAMLEDVLKEEPTNDEARVTYKGIKEFIASETRKASEGRDGEPEGL